MGVGYDENNYVIGGRYNPNMVYEKKPLISLDSAIQIVKNETPKENATHFCWDQPKNESCYPKIKREIYLKDNRFSIKNSVIDAIYIFCIDKYCTIGYTVNAFTSEFVYRKQNHQY